jgi:NADP-dependent 3-hydroxy acid dehydrogenase YdfG
VFLPKVINSQEVFQTLSIVTRVLITVASKGIGKATALLFARQGLKSQDN